MTMSKLIMDDPNIVARLREVQGRTEIFDSSGRVLGLFVRYKSPYSKEELEHRYREGAATARPLSEFFDEMERKYPGEFKRPE